MNQNHPTLVEKVRSAEAHLIELCRQKKATGWQLFQMISLTRELIDNPRTSIPPYRIKASERDALVAVIGADQKTMMDAALGLDFMDGHKRCMDLTEDLMQLTRV